MTQMCPSCSLDNEDGATTCTSCGTALQDLLGNGSILSERYKVVSVLGCGAMGAVYLAQDNRLVGRRCAVKENRPDPAMTDEMKDRARQQFLAEASVLARLDHSRLPKVSDYFLENDQEYLVMDYVDGDDLVTMLANSDGPLDEATVVDWTDQVLDALEYLHSQEPQPIIHRDIKPANLRINSRGNVKLVDFGLVKLFDPNDPATKIELRGLGTPAYAPLEQFAGSGKHTDARSDIYSLGATVYHLLTAAPPTEVHQRLLDPKSLTPPRELNKKLSTATEQLLLKAMAVHPSERYQSAAEMRQAIAALNSGAMPTMRGRSTASSQKSVPGWAMALIALLLVALLGGGAYIFTMGNSGATNGQPIAQANESEEEPETDDPLVEATDSQLVAPLSDAPTTDPTETSVAAATDPTAAATDSPTPTATVITATATLTATATPTPTNTATPGAAVVNPARGDVIPEESLTGVIAYPVFNGVDYDLYFGQADGSGVSFFRAHASQPDFSPNGGRLAFHSWQEPWGLVVMQLPDSVPSLIADFVEDQLPTWTANGQDIIYLSRREGDRKSRLIKVGSRQVGSRGAVLGEGEYPSVGLGGELVFKGWGNTGNGLRLADVNLNGIRPVTNLDGDTAPALSPNGQQVAFMSRRDGNWDVYIIDVDGSNLTRLTTDLGEDGLPTWSPDGRLVAFVSQRQGQWSIQVSTPTGQAQQKLFDIQGSPDGFVGANRNASRGWTEERISWSR